MEIPTAQQAAIEKYPTLIENFGKGFKADLTPIRREYFIEGWNERETYATQQSASLHTRIAELEGEVERLKKALEEIRPKLMPGTFADDTQIVDIIDNALNPTNP